MSDLLIDLLKTRVDSQHLNYVNTTKKGRLWHSPCPVCGGKDRFHAWPDQAGGAVAVRAGVFGTWWCRNCNKSGDMISFLIFSDGVDFKTACQILRIELSDSGRKISRPLRPLSKPFTWQPITWLLPPDLWRDHATKMAKAAHKQLLLYPKALQYLAGRGLSAEAVRRYSIGFLRGEDKTGTCLYRAKSAFGLTQKKEGEKDRQRIWIPRGFTIPLWSPSWQKAEEVHRIRIRRPKADLKGKDPKYLLLKGSSQAPMILPPENRRPDLCAWVVVESELDAMAVHHACGAHIGVVAVLTNRGKPDARAHKFLSVAPVILVALDFDPMGKNNERPGFQGWGWWKTHYAKAKRWPVPAGKDPGEAIEKGIDLADWIRSALSGPLDFSRAENRGTSVFAERG